MTVLWVLNFQLHKLLRDIIQDDSFSPQDIVDAIKAAGLETITPVIICNSDDYKEIKRFTGKQVKPGDDVMELIKE